MWKLIQFSGGDAPFTAVSSGAAAFSLYEYVMSLKC